VWTRNPPEEWLFTGNYQLIDEKFTGRMIVPPGITSKGTKNQPDEWDSAENFQLVDDKST
jgi:hypothetical protein